MGTQITFPKVTAVTPLSDWRLRVAFSSGEVKVYDCRPLLDSEPFQPLREPGCFSRVHSDPHGYGVLWDDEIDLAESELWLHGETAEQGAGHESPTR